MNTLIHKINKNIILGWLVIVSVLFVTYAMEVVKGERTFWYLVVFMFFTAVPALYCWHVFRHFPEYENLQYEIVVGYFVMYFFVMSTGSTPLVFTYILPILSLLVLYHNPRLIFWTGTATVVTNFSFIVKRYLNGELNVSNSKDAEIQLALVILCFVGSFLATRIYNLITIQNKEYLEMLAEKNIEIQHMTLQTITTIANTIDAKDEYTRGHSRRVAEYSVAIAKKMGMNTKEAEEIRSIALLHDIGKIGVPDAILNKPGRLTDVEFGIMKRHTVVGYDILRDIVNIPGIDVGARYHHERYDGKGYPEGLKGEEIPLIARIIAVADAYDAMTSNRVYRKHLEMDHVLSEIKNGLGKQFDPVAGQAMVDLIESRDVEKIAALRKDRKEIQEATALLSRIMEHKENQMEEEFTMDELTGVYDRDQGKKIISLAIERGNGTLLLFDIDHFRRLNEEIGFVNGDMCLKILVESIRTMANQTVISRFGSDEFVVYLNNVTTKEAATKALEVFYENFRKNTEEVDWLRGVTASVGALVLSGVQDFNSVYSQIDKALYAIKQNGGGTYHFYQDSEREGMAIPKVDLKHLVEAIQDKDAYTGGFQVAYPEFSKIYEFIKNIAERNDQKVQLILFTVMPNKGVKVSLEDRDHVMELLDKAIINSIRTVDVVTRYSSTQKIVMLQNISEEQTNIVTSRIMTDFYKMYDCKDVSVYYDCADLSKLEQGAQGNDNA